jgi:ApeA N-terminal domain 1
VNETRWKGTWWTPGAQGDAKPGTLHYNDDGQLKLELVGGFSLMEPVQAAKGVWVSQEREPLFPVIHGMCGAERFTLFDVVAVHTSGGFFGDVTDQSLDALRGLRGIHAASAAERIFDSAKVRLEYLLGWTTQTTMKASVTRKERPAYQPADSRQQGMGRAGGGKPRAVVVRRLRPGHQGHRRPDDPLRARPLRSVEADRAVHGIARAPGARR